MVNELKNKIYEELKFVSKECNNKLNETIEFNQAIKEHELINDLYGFMYVDDDKITEYVNNFIENKEKEIFKKYCTKVELNNSNENYLLEKTNEIIKNQNYFEFVELAGFRTKYFINDNETVLKKVLKHWLNELFVIVKVDLDKLPNEFIISRRGLYIEYKINKNILKITYKILNDF